MLFLTDFPIPGSTVTVTVLNGLCDLSVFRVCDNFVLNTKSDKACSICKFKQGLSKICYALCLHPLMCSTSVHFKVNVLPHSPHEKGFSPVWNRSWFCRIVIQCFFPSDKLLKTKYRVVHQLEESGFGCHFYPK